MMPEGLVAVQNLGPTGRLAPVRISQPILISNGTNVFVEMLRCYRTGIVTLQTASVMWSPGTTAAAFLYIRIAFVQGEL